MIYLGAKPYSTLLKENDSRVLAADGYLYLGLYHEALQEIRLIPQADRGLCDVMLLEARIHLHMKKWIDAINTSMMGQQKYPDKEEFVVQLAFALHQLDQGDRAVQVLLNAPEWLRKTGILHYNLGCYEARLGDVNIARQCINAAIQLNAAIKKNARIDPDLQALW